MKNAGRSTVPSPADGDHFSLSNASGSRGAIGAHGERARGDLDESGLGAWGLGLGDEPHDCGQAPATASKPSALQAQAVINSPPSRTQTPSHAGRRADRAPAPASRAGSARLRASSNRRSSGRGSTRLGVDASSMLTHPAWKRPSHARAKYAKARSRSCVTIRPSMIVAAQLVAGPARVVAAVRGFDAQQPLTRLRPLLGARLLPERQRVAAMHAVGRCRWTSSRRRIPAHTAMCARLPRPSGPSSARRCSSGRGPIDVTKRSIAGTSRFSIGTHNNLS